MTKLFVVAHSLAQYNIVAKHLPIHFQDIKYISIDNPEKMLGHRKATLIIYGSNYKFNEIEPVLQIAKTNQFTIFSMEDEKGLINSVVG